MGSRAYPVNARIASRAASAPSHGTGSSSPNSARLGNHLDHIRQPQSPVFAQRSCRVSSTPTGSPIAAASSHRKQRKPKMLERKPPDLRDHAAAGSSITRSTPRCTAATYLPHMLVLALPYVAGAGRSATTSARLQKHQPLRQKQRLLQSRASPAAPSCFTRASSSFSIVCISARVIGSSAPKGSSISSTPGSRRQRPRQPHSLPLPSAKLPRIPPCQPRIQPRQPQHLR